MEPPVIDVLVVGAKGRMGALTATTVADQPDMQVVGAVDPAYGADEPSSAPAFRSVAQALAGVHPAVAVEFSTPASVFENVHLLLQAGVHTVVGATGLTAPQVAELARIARSGDANLLVAPNFSVGAVLLMRFAREAARHYERAEIIELHHEDKVDAPSGTALRTASLMAEAAGSRLRPAPATTAPSRGLADGAVPIHSVRLPGLVAHQEVLLGATGELLTLRHDSLSRESFMPGVLLAIRNVALLEEVTVGLENLLA
jgi:4-hydroxy-tetrahydrodipicolinate reductase